MTFGLIPPNPSELLGSEKMKKLVHVLSEHYDVVLFETPSVNAVKDATILSTLSDGLF